MPQQKAIKGVLLPVLLPTRYRREGQACRLWLCKSSDTAASAAIDAFKEAARGTRVIILGRSAITASVPQIMRAGKKELLVLDDLVGSLYAGDEPEFADAYKSAGVIVDAGRGAEGRGWAVEGV